MRSIFTSLVWRMAWRNLRSQPRQTWLTIMGGGIGAALITTAIIFFQSFDESGTKWMKKHYGPIDWELRPSQGKPYFSQDNEEAIRSGLSHYDLKLLPAVIFETDLTKVDSALEPVRTGLRYLAMGLDFSQASSFDSTNALWDIEMSKDQIIVSEAIATPLGLAVGDTVVIDDVRGEPQLFQVFKVVREDGLTGYRGLFAAEGTLLMRMDRAREMRGLLDDAATSILTGTGQVDETLAVHIPLSLPIYEVQEQKLTYQNQVQKMKLRHGLMFLICSVSAVIAGALLMIQILSMLAHSRRESLALLRALGFQIRQIRMIFLTETMLINLLSTGVGLALGLLLGYGVVSLYGWLNSDLAFAYSASTIPILPHITLGGMLLSGLLVLGLLTMVALLASYQLGRLQIVPALRGDNESAPSARLRRFQAGVRVVFLMIAIVVLGVHLIQFLSGQSVNMILGDTGRIPLQSLGVFALWFGASIAAMYLLVMGLPFMYRVIRPILLRLGIEEAAQMIAFRYPAGNYRRTFIVTLLFSSCFMILVFILIFTHHNVRLLAQKSYTILDYPAFVTYQDDKEKDKVLSLLEEDAFLAEKVLHAAVMEPYMISFASNEVFLEDGFNQMNLTVPSEAFQAGGAPKLSQRAPRFATDEEAWQAVLDNPNYVIMDHKYSYHPKDWPDNSGMHRELSRQVNIGDRLTLNVYEKPPKPNTPRFGQPAEVVDSVEIEVIGFAETKTGMEFYNVLFVHPEPYVQLKEHGYRWEYLLDKGYILLSLASADISELRKVEEAMSVKGIKGFSSPGISEASEDLNLVQMMWIFIGFMALSMNIGLAGLAILQYRAIQERARTLAMIRCIGLSNKIVRQMLLLEGTLIGWLGLLNGCLFGSIGGSMIVEMFVTTSNPTEITVFSKYPWEYVLPIIGAMLLIALLLNIAPSRTVLRLSPGMRFGRQINRYTKKQASNR